MQGKTIFLHRRVLNQEDDPFCSAKDRAFLLPTNTSLFTPSALLKCISLLSFFTSLEICSILHQCATHPFLLCHKLSSSKVPSLSLSYCTVDQLLPAISQFLALQVVWAGLTFFFLHHLSPVVQWLLELGHALRCSMVSVVLARYDYLFLLLMIRAA